MSAPRRCSFCLKMRAVVKVLVAAQDGKAICDECVAGAARVLEEGGDEEVVAVRPPTAAVIDFVQARARILTARRPRRATTKVVDFEPDWEPDGAA